MKFPLLAASLVLVAGTAAGCGGGAPTDASSDEFCDAYGKVFESAAGAVGEGPSEDQIKAVKEAFADLEEVGTPEDIPDDAREGFELITESVADIDDDASAEELQEAGEDFSGDDEKKATAFNEYVAKTCTDLSLPGMPEMPDLPDASPTE